MKKILFLIVSSMSSPLLIAMAVSPIIEPVKQAIDHKLVEKATEGDIHSVKMLLNAGADANAKDLEGTSALAFAGSRGHDDIAKLLIDEGASVNMPNNFGTTPLHLAASYANKDTVKTLVDAGANVNAEQVTGVTPLMYAGARNDHDVVKVLLEEGADITKRDNNNMTAADHAQETSAPPVLALLGAANQE